MTTPETRYADSGGVRIAYQVIGEGPRDLVFVPGWVTNIEVFWEDPGFTRFAQRLAAFSRLILFDKRGTGLSDRVTSMPNLETRMDDVRAVMDAVGSERAALLGFSEGGSMCALFAATYPDRTAALILVGSFARRLRGPDYPWAVSPEAARQAAEVVVREWGGPVWLDRFAPSMAADDGFRAWWARFLRMGASPASSAALMSMNADIDVRAVLPTVRVPTLVLRRREDRITDPRDSRYLAEHIPHAKLVELPGGDHMVWVGDSDAVVDEIEEFLTGVRHGPEADRILTTIVFTDIVGSTERAAALGDRRWREVLGRHHSLVRRELARFRGQEIDTAGDGFFAAFDGPARAVRCACAISRGVREIGLQIRAGVHTGECEVADNRLTGIAVHIGARVAALAGPGEVLVSTTVKDLVAGSGLSFSDRGRHALKGLSGDWHLFRATDME